MTVAVPIDTDPAGPPFEVRRPARLRTPLVFASPHSGRVYPADMMAASKLNARDIRRSEDALVDNLIEGGEAAGAALILCRVGRAYVDVNREPWELDADMFADAVPAHARAVSARVAAGLGSVPRVVGDGRAIYARKLSFAEAEARIAGIHQPYHAALEDLLAEAQARFGVAVLIDWHSMPSAASRAEARRGRPRPDVVLGDRHGAACAPGLTALVKRDFERSGYVVALNRPYAGGYTTQTHGRPEDGRHALQVELDRQLYMDERTLLPAPAFDRVRRRLESLFSTLAETDWPGVLGG